MPEGDTIHRLAAGLRPDLEGRAIDRLYVRTHGDVAAVVGRKVVQVHALGKNLLIGIEDDWVIRIHLGLRGRARRLREHEARAPIPAGWPLYLQAGPVRFACTRAAHARLHRRADMHLEAALRNVGPDLLDPASETADIVARARAAIHADREIAVVLADQQIAAGIGNVYKSEVLFLEGVDPFARMQQLDDATVARLYRTARRLLESNLGPGPRVTVGELRGARRRPETATLWVYRRAGLPCLRCKTTIEMRRQGDMARSTYLCPRCQPATSDTTA